MESFGLLRRACLSPNSRLGGTRLQNCQDEETDGTGVMTSPSQSVGRHLTCLIACSVTLLTTAILLHVHHVVHPFTLLLAQAFLACAVSSVINSVRYEKSLANQPISLERPQHDMTLVSRLCLCLVLLPSILSWIFTYAALSTTQNPFVVVMVAGIHLHQTISQPFHVKIILGSVVQLVAIALVLRYDYRLSEQSLWWIVPMVVSSSLAHLIRSYWSSIERQLSFDFHQLRQSAYLMALPILFLLALSERAKYGSILERPLSYRLVAINIVCGAISIAMGGHLKRPMYCTQDNADGRFDAPLLVGIFGVAYHYFARDTMIPPQQVLAYALAIVCSTKDVLGGTVGQATHVADHSANLKQSNASDEESHRRLLGRSSEETATAADTSILGLLSGVSKAARLSRFLALLTTMCWTFLLLQSLGLLGPLLAAPPVAYLVQHSSPRPSIDFVVAYHDESVVELGQTLQTLLALDQITGIQRRVFVYNKGSDTKHIELELGIGYLLSASDIEVRTVSRPDQSRESETYLTHILDTWDDLASHTVFMQASMREHDRAVSQLKDYLVPNTGFMSLSYSSDFCRDCTTCADLVSRRTDSGSVYWLYNFAYKGRSTCQNIPLTTGGQFVASAARIRGGGKLMYSLLRSALIEDTSSEYVDKLIGGSSDVMTSEDFGSLLERMWSVVMQCADERIADRCPSPLSNKLGMLGSVRDCQCLDEVSG